MLRQVLILDHRSPWTSFVAKTLSAYGYDVIERGSYGEALALLEKATRWGEGYAFIIVDPLNGRPEDHETKLLEVARTIAKHFPSVPLIVASSRPTPDEAVLAYELGALAYITKTCDEKEFMESVKKAIHRVHSGG